MFAALILAKPDKNPIVIERGSAVEKRQEQVFSFWYGEKLNPESNVQFGEGGAGTFSDGKLNTGTKDGRARKVLLELAGSWCSQRNFVSGTSSYRNRLFTKYCAKYS